MSSFVYSCPRIIPGQCIVLQCKVLPRIQGGGRGHCTTVVWDGMPEGNTGQCIVRSHDNMLWMTLVSEVDQEQIGIKIVLLHV